MKTGKIKPVATIVAQFAAGVEVDAIQHEGKLFLPVMNLLDFGSVEPAPSKEVAEKPAKKSAPAPVVEDEEEEEEAPKTKATKASADVYTEDALMEMDTKAIVKILTAFGIDPDDTEGKNTNKKLRKLVLDAQKKGGAAPAAKKAVKEEVAEEAAEETDDVASAVAEILEDFDSGKLNKKKTITKLMEHASDGVEDSAISPLVTAFEDDGDSDIDETAKEIALALSGAAKPKKGKATKKKKEEVLVEADDLEEGQRVSVYWEDQEEWYDGTVGKIKKGKVTIDYDDDTQEVLDENNTKIKLLED